MCAFEHGKIDFAIQKKKKEKDCHFVLITQTLSDQHIHTVFLKLLVPNKRPKHAGSNLTSEFPSNPVTVLHVQVYKTLTSTLCDLTMTQTALGSLCTHIHCTFTQTRGVHRHKHNSKQTQE